MFHDLLITSPEDVENGSVEIIIGKEVGEAKPIIHSAVLLPTNKTLEIVGNKITHIVLCKGKNKIRIKFADEMQHSITLKAYENK